MKNKGLYDPKNEHDSCGVGFIANIKGFKSHSIIQQGLQILKNLDHRGAVGSDPLMGDGAGILTQIPHNFYKEEMKRFGIFLPPPGEYGVGMVFLPKESASRIACEKEIERAVTGENQVVLGWRDVPVCKNMPMAKSVRNNEPVIRQIFIGRGPDIMVTDALERKLYVIRKLSGHAIKSLNLIHGKEFYIPSMSARTIVYKGLLLADQVGIYYKDLQNNKFISSLSLVHQRFSTNTFPEWPLAHPYRMVAHNGEINTVKGNFNWMRAREGVMKSNVLAGDLKKLFPLIYEGQSDTASFDNVLELLVMAGYPISQAMMMMIPEAWENHSLMDQNRRAFYEYHASMMEPWDGPAAVAFTDGRYIGGTLDRNGLRPARYIVTDNNLVVMASESGVLPIPESKIIKKWRLQPGKMFLIDLEAGRIIDDKELKDTFANARPYKQWIDSVRIKLNTLKSDVPKSKKNESLRAFQRAFGYTQEDLKFLLLPMAKNGEEPTGSMGNDSPLAVMSNKNKQLFNYFKQLFAQVTNPPIDPIRESLVMSLVSFIGPKPNLLDTNNINPQMRLEISQPILDQNDIDCLYDIARLTRQKFKSFKVDICYPVKWGKEGIEAKLASLCSTSEDAVRSGHNILILSDRVMDKNNVAIPSLLATSAIHQHLIKKGLRSSTGLVVETGSARETHHFSLLAGYGAEATFPYLAIDTLIDSFKNQNSEFSNETIVTNYKKAIGKGLLKVFSKMGISTYMSYCGAQIFEAIGLNTSLINKYFNGTPSNVEGIGIFEVAEEAIRLHKSAFSNDLLEYENLDSGGEYAYRVNGEEHMWTPDAIAKLQHSTRSNNFKTYEEYAKIINDQSRRHMTLRGLFEFNFDYCNPINIDEVEDAKNIVKRFSTGAMSLGSISTEAHSTLAIALNRIGGKSNTGEGGEDENRYRDFLRQIPIKDGDTLSSVIGRDQVEVNISLKKADSLRSKIKQVASGRFGVSAEYLVSADQIQIKMAQGAKPGEGGQLPGHKVSEYIARLRFSVPGVGLISPPPHHDIYSIEDLAQLIHDLKNVNPRASISVKLVSEVGVGTIAAGVAKAKSDHIVIAGHDGGTGASPLSSIKHAGTPWELGIAETQQTLLLNGLRSRVCLQTDGQIKTGRDVVIGALLGADEFGFATAPLVVEGCIMMRKCHLNTCPVGVATQDPILRSKFKGNPDHVVNYFFFVAEEVRKIMSNLGIRFFNELVGRSDLLNKSLAISHWKAKGLNFDKIFFMPSVSNNEPRYHKTFQDHGLEKSLDHDLILNAKPAIEFGKKVSFSSNVRNVNRTVGSMLSGVIAKKYGHRGLPDNTIKIDFEGIAGQSFGSFLSRGITLNLIGECNDYVGKSLSGGLIIVSAHSKFKGKSKSDQNIIVGNTVFYGAISGQGFFNGVAGERFAVRNSGAVAVVEGLGDHGCEYMTGGTVVVLGSTGRNFAAGMSGGISYVYDPDGNFHSKCNLSMVTLEEVLLKKDQLTKMPISEWHSADKESGRMCDETILKNLIELHIKYTESIKAKRILSEWISERKKFVKVFPNEYRRALNELYVKEKSLKKEKIII